MKHFRIMNQQGQYIGLNHHCGFYFHASDITKSRSVFEDHVGDFMKTVQARLGGTLKKIRI